MKLLLSPTKEIGPLTIGLLDGVLLPLTLFLCTKSLALLNKFSVIDNLGWAEILDGGVGEVGRAEDDRSSDDRTSVEVEVEGKAGKSRITRW